MSVDTLLNWADIGTNAHTSERVTSLLRQMPLRLGEGQKHALACPMRTPGEAMEGMEKIATHGSIQKSVMVKKIAMGVSNQRTTNTVGNQECHCSTESVN